MDGFATIAHEPNQVAEDWREFEGDLKELCKARAADFHLLGYESVSANEVWACVQKMTKGQVSLHQWVANVLSLNIGQFMNFTTMNAYKGVFLEDEFDAPK